MSVKMRGEDLQGLFDEWAYALSGVQQMPEGDYIDDVSCADRKAPWSEGRHGLLRLIAARAR